jgi:putative transposase
VIRKMELTGPTSYGWKKRYGFLGISELRSFKQLEEENRKLKQMVADLSLDKYMLQDVLSKEFSCPPTGVICESNSNCRIVFGQ